MSRARRAVLLLHVIFLPLALDRARPFHVPWPNLQLAGALYRAAERFATVYPPASLFPGYRDLGTGSPSPQAALANVSAACHDFPDQPATFGPGAHRRACDEWVATYLATYHAARVEHAFGQVATVVPGATRITGAPVIPGVPVVPGATVVSDAAAIPGAPVVPGATLILGAAAGADDAADLAWMGHYLDIMLEVTGEFVYGPGETPGGADRPSYRDTLAAVWQNPMRASDLAFIADVLHRHGALSAAQASATEERLSGIARAWYAEFWTTGVQPSTGVSLTTRTAAEAPAFSFAGKQVTSQRAFTLRWDADHGNTPAEEVAWMGNGVLMATRVLGDRLEDGPVLADAARRYLDLAVAYDRPDPRHPGRQIRTLNAETTGGAYGQRRYWLENHTPDTPSIPYVGSAFLFIGLALMTDSAGRQTPWASLLPRDAEWQVFQLAAGETLRAPDGRFLVDLAPGRGIGYLLDDFPAWWSNCAQPAGRQYVRVPATTDRPALYVSEIGHPAGLDLILAGWPLLRLAAHRRDQPAYDVWADRLGTILDEYAVRPPDPNWGACQVTPYLSANPAYHWSRMAAALSLSYLGASGYGLETWP